MALICPDGWTMLDAEGILGVPADPRLCQTERHETTLARARRGAKRRWWPKMRTVSQVMASLADIGWDHRARQFVESRGCTLGGVLGPGRRPAKERHTLFSLWAEMHGERVKVTDIADIFGRDKGNVSRWLDRWLNEQPRRMAG